MIEIQTLNRTQLAEFIQSTTFQHLPDLPISVHRAMSQIINPRAEENDTILILAWLDREMVGYLGVFPDRYFTGENTSEKCGWLSCLWVSDRHRGKSIAKKLVARGTEALNGHIILTEFTPQAKQLYDKLGLFSDLRIYNGIRIYFRLELHRLLPPKRDFFKKIKPLLQITDGLANVFIDMVAALRPAKRRIASCEEVSAVDAEIQHFIAEKQERELFRRGAKELNWALKNPWILNEAPDDMSRRYYFSSVDDDFRFTSLKVYDAEKRLRAFLILAKRNRSLKMPCCYLEKGSEALVAEVVGQYIRQWRINTFSTFHPEMVHYYRTKRTFALYKKDLKHHYLATKRMTENLAGYDFELQDGDGDAFFT